ncbi:MAG: sugar phosphate isomerase/epimerase [Candidatus Omnitrophota bacterium]
MVKIACHSLTWGNFYKDKPYPIENVLKDVKESGFDGVELFEPITRFGEPRVFQKLLRAHGLALATLSGNLNLTSADNKDMEEAKEKIRFLHSLGITTFMLCGAWMSDTSQKTDTNFKNYSARLEELSKYAKGFNVDVAFHPHLNTLVETGEDIERLYKHISITKLCIDIAHLAARGSDPIGVIKQYAPQTKLIHLKDWDAGEKRFVELGKGVLRDTLKDIIAQIKATGYAGWLVCELDETRISPKESAKINRTFLKTIGL